MGNLTTEFTEIFDKEIIPKRADAKNLLSYLNSTSFFDDPASAKKHSSFEHGLVLHSINVYTSLKKLIKTFPNNYSEDSIAIVSLLHDVCKIGTYEKTARNKKEYITDGNFNNYKGYQIKKDELGKFVWKSELSYQNIDPFPYGHGEKSVYIISKYMKLTDEEAQAIRFHMGMTIESDKFYCSNCYENNPLALALHWADEYATYIVEKGN